LNFTTLTTSSNGASRRVKSNFHVEVRSGAWWIDLDECASETAAIAWNGREVTEEVLAYGSFARVPVAYLQLAQWHTTTACIDDIEVWLDLIVARIGV